MANRSKLLLVKFIEWLVIAIISIASALKAVYPVAVQKPSSFFEYLHSLFLYWYLEFISVAAILGIVAKLAQELLSNESKIRLKATLDSLHEIYFEDVPEAQRYENRVTLFKTNGRGTCLHFYCRSGTQYQRKVQSLRIDSNNQTGNEGIAGQAWFRNATVSKYDLPECPNPWSDSDPACIKYANESLLPMEKARKLNVKSKSIVATSIERLKGQERKQWGVLVLDSRDAKGIDPNKERMVRSFAAALGKLL